VSKEAEKHNEKEVSFSGRHAYSAATERVHCLRDKMGC
jgi:hypothetical protein